MLTSLTTGTIIMTRSGEMPVEWLEPSDEILTRDGGFKPILWLNRVRFNRAEFRYFPEFRPVCLKAGVLADGEPAHDLKVSPHQLVMYRSPRAELEYWSSEVLVPACVLGEPMDTERLKWHERVCYTQILLPGHHLMSVDGLWLGSLYTADFAVESVPSEALIRSGLKREAMQAARPILTEQESRLLVESDRAADRKTRDDGEGSFAKTG